MATHTHRTMQEHQTSTTAPTDPAATASGAGIDTRGPTIAQAGPAPGASAGGMGLGGGSTTADVGRGSASSLAGRAPERGTVGQSGQTPGDAYGKSTGAKMGEKVKGVFAQGHGIGENLRGNINAAVDSFAGHSEGQARDEEIARKGAREVSTGRFENTGTRQH